MLILLLNCHLFVGSCISFKKCMYFRFLIQGLKVVLNYRTARYAFAPLPYPNTKKPLAVKNFRTRFKGIASRMDGLAS